MPDRNSFAKDVDRAVTNAMYGIQQLVLMDVDIIGLNEVHPEFFARFERKITETCPNMRFLGAQPPRCLSASSVGERLREPGGTCLGDLCACPRHWGVSEEGTPCLDAGSGISTGSHAIIVAVASQQGGPVPLRPSCAQWPGVPNDRRQVPPQRQRGQLPTAELRWPPPRLA